MLYTQFRDNMLILEIRDKALREDIILRGKILRLFHVYEDFPPSVSSVKLNSAIADLLKSLLEPMLCSG